MAKTVDVEYVELRKYLRNLEKRGARNTKKAVQNYVNQMAVKTRAESFKTMDKAFNYKNASTKKYAERFIKYKKARLNKDPNKITAEVGAKGDIDGESFKKRGGGYLAKQEVGGKIKQIKAKGTGIRSGLLLRNTKNIKGKTYKKITNKIQARPFGNKKQALAEGIRRARLRKKKYVVSPDFGVYSVTKREVKKIYSFGKVGKIKVKKRKWLEPASNNIVNKRMEIWKEAFKYFEDKLQKL